jgi:hypothetical protein
VAPVDPERLAAAARRRPAAGGATPPPAATGGSGGNTGGAGGRGGAGGTSATGGSGGNAGSGGASGSGGSGGRGPDAAPETGGSAGWPDCLEPVFSGVTPAEFCMVYGNVCGFTGMNHYTSAADCMSKFRGGSNDGDACKSGHLCRAATMPAMKEMDCRTAGTAQCRNN